MRRAIAAASRGADHHDIANLHFNLTDVPQSLHSPVDALDEILADRTGFASGHAERAISAAVA